MFDLLLKVSCGEIPFFLFYQFHSIFLDLKIWHENCLSLERKIILQRAQSF